MCSLWKAFSDWSALIKHKRTHLFMLEKSPLNVIEHNKAFSNRSSLRKHWEKNTGEKPYECNECGATFNNQSYLRKRDNTLKRSPITVTCAKAFCQMSHLVAHQRTPTAEEPGECIEYVKAFSDWSALIRYKTQENTHVRETL
mgnify:CR=1 FL=1